MKFIIKVCFYQDVIVILNTLKNYRYIVKKTEISVDGKINNIGIIIELAGDTTINDLEEVLEIIVDKHQNEIDDIDTILN